MDVKGGRKLVLLQDIGAGLVTVNICYSPANSTHGPRIRAWKIRIYAGTYTYEAQVEVEVVMSIDGLPKSLEEAVLQSKQTMDEKK